MNIFSYSIFRCTCLSISDRKGGCCKKGREGDGTTRIQDGRLSSVGVCVVRGIATAVRWQP